MKKKIFIATLVGYLMLLNSCENNPLEAPIVPGGRDYTWTADTLKFPYGEFASPISMWGSSPEDIWICGSGSSNQYRLRHFDGNEWKNIETNIPLIDAFSIFGFSKDNVWLGTDFGIIAHFDGSKWVSLGNFSSPNEDLKIQGMWGRNETDFYAFGFLDKKDRTGYKGCILKYSGLTWNFLPIDSLSLNFLTMGYDEDAKKYFIHAYRSEDDMQFIYELTGSELHKLFESHDETKIVNINGKVYFQVGSKIYRYRSNSLYVWKDFSSTPMYAGLLDGRNEKDIFTINWWGIGHYNGDDIVMLYPTDPYLWFFGRALFEKDIFIACQNIQTKANVVLHGKLNE